MINVTHNANKNVFMIHYLPIFPCFCFYIKMFTVFVPMVQSFPHAPRPFS